MSTGKTDPALTMSRDELLAEVIRLRANNAELNRRVTEGDSKWQSKAVNAEAMSEHYRESRWNDFKRMGRAYDQLRQIYLALYEARGLPKPKFHSVMDWRFKAEPGDNRSVWANIYLTKSGGVNQERVVDAVKAYLNGTWEPIKSETW